MDMSAAYFTQSRKSQCMARPVTDPSKPLVFYTWYAGFQSHGGTPKSSIIRGLSIINHPAIGGIPFLGNIHISNSRMG